MVVLSVEREFYYRLHKGSQLKLPREKQQTMAEGLRQYSVQLKPRQFTPGLLERSSLLKDIEYK